MSAPEETERERKLSELVKHALPFVVMEVTDREQTGHLHEPGRAWCKAALDLLGAEYLGIRVEGLPLPKEDEE